MSENSYLDLARTVRLTKSLCLATALVMPTAVWAGSTGMQTDTQTATKAPLVQSKKEQKISGVVVDAKTGEPIPGASILIKGTTRGTITDAQGKFTLNTTEKSILIISFIGYKTQSITATNNLNVRLSEEAEMLQDVVVVGYGTQKKVNVTGAVAQIDAKQLEARPVNNVTQALQGVIPGLNLTPSTDGGGLNASMNFDVRGKGTVGEGSVSAPLVLVDGAEGTLDALNPNDIASISVLKDAASASIYGARGSFGVILVTTKSGKKGKAQVVYSTNFRYSTAIQLPELMNPIEFAHYYNAASRNSNSGAFFSDEDIAEIEKNYNFFTNGGEGNPPVELITPDLSNRYTLQGSGRNGRANVDRFQEFLRPNAPSQEHNISVRGGSETLNYSVSGNILKAEGLFRHATDTRTRYNLSGRFGAKINDWADIDYSVRWFQNNSEESTFGRTFFNMVRRWPIYPLVDKNGHYTQDSDIPNMETAKGKGEKENLVQAITLRLSPLKGWTVNGQFTYQTSTSFQHSYQKLIYFYDADNEPYLMTPINSVFGFSEKSKHWTANLYTDYTHSFGEHNFAIKLGTNIEEDYSRDLKIIRNGLLSEDVIAINTARDTSPAVDGGFKDWALVGFFGRLNYTYADKYLFEANIRRDGSSRFIGDRRWGVFPSFSLGWNIAKEKFFRSLSSSISTLKLRASWGQLGNMSTSSNYPFFPAMKLEPLTGNWLINGEKTNRASLPDLVSDALTWERISSWDAGLDWSIWGGRLTGSFDYFVRTTFDMIGPAFERSFILGTSVPPMNNSEMRSYGWELELNWRDRIGKDFRYDVKLVLSDSQQEVTKYPNATNKINNYYPGKKLGEIWGYETVGIAKSDEEMTEHLKNNKPTFGANWAAGDIMYRDLNGDGVINSGKSTLDDHGDLKRLGNTTPRYRFGITLGAEYKGFDFRLFLQGVAKRDYMFGSTAGDNTTGYFWGIADRGDWQQHSVAFKEHLDYFRPEGDPLGENLDAYYPRPIGLGGGKNQHIQSRYIQDASYLRVKNVQLGYTLPEYLTKKIYLNKVRLYVSADNLITFTKMSKIFDPENLDGIYSGRLYSGRVYPLTRVLSVGATINL